MAISCQLKRKIYMSSSDIAGKVHALFDNSEVYWLTSKVIRKLLSMQTANFSDCMFDKDHQGNLKFYMPQEVL